MRRRKRRRFHRVVRPRHAPKKDDPADDTIVLILCEKCRNSFEVKRKNLRHRYRNLCKDCIKKEARERREIIREKRQEIRDSRRKK